MKKISLYALALFSTAIICGCGGGGGSDENSEKFFGGIYTGPIAIIQNPCRVPVSAIGTVEWTVNQDQNKVVLEAASGATFVGTITSDDSFRVTRSVPVNGTPGCSTDSEIIISESDGEIFNTDLTVRATCLPGCTVIATGALRRSLGKNLDISGKSFDKEIEDNLSEFQGSQAF